MIQVQDNFLLCHFFPVASALRARSGKINVVGGGAREERKKRSCIDSVSTDLLENINYCN